MADWRYTSSTHDSGLGLWHYLLLYEAFSSNTAPVSHATPAAPAVNLGLPDMASLLPSAGTALNVSLDDIFNRVVNNSGGVDLNPPVHHHTSSYTPSSPSTDYSQPSFGGFDGGGMSSGGGMNF